VLHTGEFLAAHIGCLFTEDQLNRRLVGPQSRSGIFGRRGKSVVPVGNRIPGRPIRRVVTARTALPGLLVKNELSCMHLFTPTRLQGEQSDSVIRCALYHYRRFPRRLYPPVLPALLVSLVTMCAQISVKRWDG